MKTKKIQVSDYDVIVGKDILKDIGSALLKRNLVGHNKTIIVSDNIVEDLYCTEIARSIINTCGEAYSIPVLSFPSGESSKTLQTATELLNGLTIMGFTRNDTIIAVGGGVVGDLVGFVASIYLRGINLVHVPTTLMAQVDSSIGGKTGVNLKLGKNLVGAFYNPRLVYCDISTLKTLPEREFVSGLAEVVKYGILEGKTLFKRVVKGVHIENDDLMNIIVRCIKYKGFIVTRDPKEWNNQRIHLNLGHTIGHAIEQSTNYKKYTHGEAVALGLRAIAFICHKYSCLPKESYDKIITALSLNGLLNNNICHKNVSEDKIISAISHDKKNSKKGVSWVNIVDIGWTCIGTHTEEVWNEKIIREAIQEIKKKI